MKIYFQNVILTIYQLDFFLLLNETYQSDHIYLEICTNEYQNI
jgi:hypothetical protein